MTKQEEIERDLYSLTLDYFQKFYAVIEKGLPVKDFPNDTLCKEILSYLHFQGVVIKVERELPEIYSEGIAWTLAIKERTRQDMLKWRNDSFEPLIEVKE